MVGRLFTHVAETANAIQAPPIFGRQQILTDARALLLEGASVALNGEEGSGKSVVAAHLSRQLHDAGRTVISVRASAHEQHKPYAAIKRALKPWSHGERQQQAGPADSRRLDEVWARASAASAARPPILVIDNALFLDQESVGWLEQLVVSDRATLLIAMNPAHPTAKTANASIMGLWQDTYLQRFDLPRLTRPDTMRMIDSLTAPETLDLRAKVIIHRESLGNPAIVKELTLSYVDAPDGYFGLEDLVFPRRLLDMVEYRLRFLDADQRAALVMLGMLGTTTYANAKRLVSRPTLASLVERGLADRCGHDGDEVFVTRLTTSALVRAEGPAEVSALFHRALHTTLETYRHGGRSTASECFTIAETWIEGDTIPVDELSKELVADVFTIAAQAANRRGAQQTAAVFAHHASELSPSVGAAIEGSRAAMSVGAVDEAVAAIAGIDATHRTDELQESALVEWRRTLAGRGIALPSMTGSAAVTGDVDETGSAAEPHEHEAELAAINTFIDDMDWESCARAADAIAYDHERTPLTRMRALAVVAVASAALGRPAELAASESHRSALQHTLESTTLTQRSSYGALALAGVALRQRIHVLTAHVGCGVDLGAVDGKLDEAIDDALALGDYAALSLLSVTAAMRALGQGDPRSAEMELQHAESHGIFPSPGRWSDWIASLHALALCRLGRFDDARARVPVASDRGMPGQSAWRRYLSITTSAAIDHAEGDYERARDAAVRGIEEFGGSSPAILTNFLVLAAVSGEPHARLREWALRIETAPLPQTRAMAEFVMSLTPDDSAAFTTADAPAADARVPYSYPLVAGSFTLRHGRASARRLRANVPEQLTNREQQIAALAAAGSSNREIAAKLFLSIRTVESHLYQAKVKLGVRSRRDLSETLVNVDERMLRSALG